MAIVKQSPTSPGKRFEIKVVNKDLHKGKPVASLVRKKSKTGGRNNLGRITTRHIGGGHKQKLRLVDFKRDKNGVPAKVTHLEYDPNRSAHLALLTYADGEKRYIIAAKGLKAGDEVMSGKGAPIKPGNFLPLSDIPLGTVIHCVEMKPLGGAKMVRSAGGAAQLVAKEGQMVKVRLKSGHTYDLQASCGATIGEVGNSEHGLRQLGKAGKSRHLGVRPTVRGTVMNPIDHPHGGGEGKTKGGRHPVTPWGVPTKGYKTRSNKRTDKFISREKKDKR